MAICPVCDPWLSSLCGYPRELGERWRGLSRLAQWSPVMQLVWSSTGPVGGNVNLLLFLFLNFVGFSGINGSIGDYKVKKKSVQEESGLWLLLRCLVLLLSWRKARPLVGPACPGLPEAPSSCAAQWHGAATVPSAHATYSKSPIYIFKMLSNVSNFSMYIFYCMCFYERKNKQNPTKNLVGEKKKKGLYCTLTEKYQSDV